MPFNFSLMLVLAIASLLTACARPVLNGKRNEGTSGISDVSIKFKDSLHPELRKHLTHYHLSIVPEDERCKREKKDTALDEIKEWARDANNSKENDLTIEKKLARDCTYLIKLAFGSMQGADSAKSLVAYFTNYEDKDGSRVTTNDKRVTADVTVDITDAGRKLGLDKYADHIESVLETDIGIDVRFNASLKLDGEYALSCKNLGGATLKSMDQTMKVVGDKINVMTRFYAQANCTAADLAIEETAEARYKLGKRDNVATAIDLVSITSKLVKVTDKHSGAYCGKADWQKNVAEDALKVEACRNSAGFIANFDLVDLKDKQLRFGAKSAAADGSKSELRPKVLDTAADMALIKK